MTIGSGEDPCIGTWPRVACYNLADRLALQTAHSGVSPHLASRAMTSEQAAQLIDNTLDLVHQRLLDLESRSLRHEHRALAAEFREWRQPTGGHIDLMVFPGLSSS